MGAVSQEQLALYYGVGKYISANTRTKNWGSGFIEGISELLRKELPGLRGFSAPCLRKMRTFYEEWRLLSDNSFVETNKLPCPEAGCNGQVADPKQTQKQTIAIH